MLHEIRSAVEKKKQKAPNWLLRLHLPFEESARQELVPSRQPGLTSYTLNTHVHLLPLTGGSLLFTKCTLPN